MGFYTHENLPHIVDSAPESTVWVALLLFPHFRQRSPTYLVCECCWHISSIAAVAVFIVLQQTQTTTAIEAMFMG